MFKLKLTKQEIKTLLIASLVMIFWACLPYLYGYLSRGSLYYTGLHLFAPFDGQVYFSYLEQIKQGKILLDNLYTNEQDIPQLLNPFWLVVGMLTKIFKLPVAIGFHLARVILIPLFLYFLYKFIALFVWEKFKTKKFLYFLFSLFASGWGGFTLLFGPLKLQQIENYQLPMDLWVTESNNFFIILNSPHFLASITLMIAIFYFYYLTIIEKKLRYSLLTGLLALILFSFHPFYILTIYFVALFYLAGLFIKEKKISLKRLFCFLMIFIISAPAIFYYGYLLLVNWQMQIKAAQNYLPTPTDFNFIASYGFSLFLALFAIYFLLKKRQLNEKNLFLIIWFFISIFLMFAPFNFQRRLSQGFQVPLNLLAFSGLLVIFEFLKNKWPSFRKIKLGEILSIIILLFCFSNLVVYFSDFKFLSLKPEVVYIRPALKQALAWYQAQTTWAETILTSRINGAIIPGQTGRRVFLGHDVETINYTEKLKQIAWFFKDNENDLVKKEFLKNNNIDYIFYSYREKEMGNFKPQDKDYLIMVFQNSEVTIYKVTN